MAPKVTGQDSGNLDDIAHNLHIVRNFTNPLLSSPADPAEASGPWAGSAGLRELTPLRRVGQIHVTFGIKNPIRALWYLRKLGLFEGLTSEEYNQLIPHIEACEYQSGGKVYDIGDPSDFLYFVQGGRVRCSKYTRDGRTLTLSFMVPVEFFGESNLFDGSPREEMVEALRGTTVTRIPRSVILEKLRTIPAVGFNFGQATTARAHALGLRLEAIVFKDAYAKVAQLLLELGKRHGKRDSQGGLYLDFRLTQQEMADILGSSRETMSTTLTEFRRRSLLALARNSVTLLDIEGLKALV